MTRKANQDTYNKIFSQGLLENRQSEVYHTLFHCGPLGKTALNQMCAQMSGIALSDVWSDQIAKMFGRGLLVWLGKVACPNTNIVEDVWDVTEKMPKDKPDDAITSADAQAQQQIPGTEASAASAKPLKDNKPPKKKLKEAVDHIYLAVTCLAQEEGQPIPESVQHTLRWLRKSNERTRKGKRSNGAQDDTPQSQTEV